MSTKQKAFVLSDGWVDPHVHLDRARTYEDEYFAHEGGMAAFVDIPLRRKQTTTGVLHRGLAYAEDNLFKRMRSVIDDKITGGEAGMNAIVDCSVDIGDRAFRVAKALQAEYLLIGYDLQVGAYPIFGFKDWGSDRYQLIRDLAPEADFLMGLPERDDDHPIGFDGHLRVLLDLALEFNIPVQVHVDQTNTPTENGTERLIDAVKWIYTAAGVKNPPEVWAVHAISPSGYDGERFKRDVEGLLEHKIGVIVCPHAALSMRQMRNHFGPTRNSIARVRELLLAGVKVRIGTDNLKDLFMPLPEDVLLRREYDVLASALRFYNRSVLDKIFAGQELNETDRQAIQRSIDGDYEAFGLI